MVDSTRLVCSGYSSISTSGCPSGHLISTNDSRGAEPDGLPDCG